MRWGEVKSQARVCLRFGVILRVRLGSGFGVRKGLRVRLGSAFGVRKGLRVRQGSSFGFRGKLRVRSGPEVCVWVSLG